MLGSKQFMNLESKHKTEVLILPNQWLLIPTAHCLCLVSQGKFYEVGMVRLGNILG